MFVNNKYKKIYDNFMYTRKGLGRQKAPNDGLYVHHIIPRSLGGTDNPDNLVTLTLKEHRIAHRLLTKFTTGNSYWKMLHAYSFFDKSVDLTPSPFTGWTSESHARGVKTRKRKGSYKTGKNNVFSSEKVKLIVKHRMKTRNPMKNPEVVDKYKRNRPHSNHVKTPDGYFYSLREAAKFYNTTPHMVKKVVKQNPTTHHIITPSMRGFR